MAAKNQFVFGKVSAGHLTKEVLCHRLITNLYVWLYQWMVITNALNVTMSLREILFCRVRIHRAIFAITTFDYNYQNSFFFAFLFKFVNPTDQV